jgi:beta-glucosidase
VDRHWVNVNLSDRALYEIYLPAFRAAMQEGGSWSIMGAYNLYKGQYACHNSILLQDILRKEWGSDAAVISDWGGAMNTEQAITNGLDLEFGTWTDGLSDGASSAYDIYHLALPYLRKIQSGEVGTKELDEKVRNVLRLIFRTSMNPNKPFGAMCSEAHSAAARQIAGEGMVLLRNENHTLPIELTQHPTILVVGENAIKMMTVGGGSSSLKAKYEISPLQGIQERAEGLAEVKYVRGYVGDIGGEYNGVTTGQSLQDDRTPEQLTAEAVEAAKSADYVVFVGGMNKAHNQDCEDGDRLHYELPYAQDHLISALAAVNDKVIFVSISGNAHGMPWNQEVEAILQAWYSGSETGHAVADVLFGDVNPSGKLPYTIQPTLADYPAHQYGEEAYPGVDKQVYYQEDIFVGYRYADLYGTRRPIKYVSQGKQYTINPPKHQALFPFGFGLSYTTFEYSKATLDGNQITVSITNTGNRAGQEVVQLYITDSKASVVRPKKELKGFSKVALLPGETKQVTFTITPDMLSYFDADAHHWIAEEGLFVIHIASSSTDIHASLPYNYKK